ncbi:MAG: helix-turn-helix domain-containing protein [Actinomycetes bacterium]
MSDTTGELLAAFVAATEERKAEALKVLKGLAVASDPVAPKPLVGPLLLGMGAAARFLGVSRATLWRAVQAGAIEKVELYAGSYRMRRADLEELATRRMPTGGFLIKSRRGRPRKVQKQTGHLDTTGKTNNSDCGEREVK